MSEKEFIFDELRAKVGKGSGLYVQDASDGLYRLLLPLVEVPIPAKNVNSIEIKVACSDTITKIESTTTMEDAEAPVYVHRDVLRILENIDGKLLHLLAKTGEHTGFKFDGTVSYTVDNVKMDEAMQGTVKIVPNTKTTYIDDVFPLCKPTAKFMGAVAPLVELATKTGTEEFAISVWPEDATVTAKSDAVGVATVAVENGTVKITGVAKGSTVIELTVAKEGYAPWTTTVHVVVPDTVGA